MHDPREVERRLLLDTYRTFGCKSGQPTFRYSLLDGVRDGVLINPTVVDARTDVTTQLLSDEGFVATFTDDTGEDQEETYKQREFEKRFFSEATNVLFLSTVLDDYSRFILAWRLCTGMATRNVTDTLKAVLGFTGLNHGNPSSCVGRITGERSMKVFKLVALNCGRVTWSKCLRTTRPLLSSTREGSLLCRAGGVGETY